MLAPLITREPGRALRHQLATVGVLVQEGQLAEGGRGRVDALEARKGAAVVVAADAGGLVLVTRIHPVAEHGAYAAASLLGHTS